MLKYINDIALEEIPDIKLRVNQIFARNELDNALTHLLIQNQLTLFIMVKLIWDFVDCFEGPEHCFNI